VSGHLIKKCTEVSGFKSWGSSDIGANGLEFSIASICTNSVDNSSYLNDAFQMEFSTFDTLLL